MRKFEFTFSMSHAESTIVKLELEEIEGKTENEILALAEETAWRQIRQECDYQADDIIEVEEIEEE